MPKNGFRKLARVVIGRNCSAQGLRVAEYNYHPEFRRRSYSSLVLIQLNLDDNFDRRELQPICGPPKKLVETRLYAMILSENCKKSKVRIYEMDYVVPKECKEFYKKAELDIATIWPVNSVCAQCKREGKCVWRDGAVLAVKQKGVWHLMGFGVNGPGCGSPSRFLDFTMYQRWVTQSVTRTAMPAITRLHNNHLILRTSMNIQRFGLCDPEEMSLQIFTETKIMNSAYHSWSDDKTPEVVRYNLTLFTTIDYTCVILLATYPKTVQADRPKIDLKTYSSVPKPIYYNHPSYRLHFYVEIRFIDSVIFKVTAYGRERQTLEHKAVLKRTPEYNPRLIEHPTGLPALRPNLYDPEHEMFEDIDAFTRTNNIFADNFEFVNESVPLSTEVPEKSTDPLQEEETPASDYVQSRCGVPTVSYVPYLSYRIEMFPWLGFLTYPLEKRKLFITTAVLVTRYLVIASASDIDQLPKLKFRALARVVLGRDCNGPGMRIVDYTFHPHYGRGSYSALALVQLHNLDYVKMNDIRPICGPPAKMDDLEAYAVVMNPGKYCERLDVKSIWPRFTVCTRSVSMGDCMWKDGSILVDKDNGRWRLLGFGVNGPGCGMPSRYIDYSIYYRWIESTIERFGRPAFTRRSSNHIILRKTYGIQRYGVCDAGEVTDELFTDETTIDYNSLRDTKPDMVDYNVTIFTNIDYSCIMFTAVYYRSMLVTQRMPPRVEIRYYCIKPPPTCYETGIEKIDFAVKIVFKGRLKFKMAAYGRERKVVDVKRLMKYINQAYPRYNITMLQLQYRN
ncbi:uncharacterized protein LOC126379686 [Pectinophora gossypiella]|uniref:uncharacterized protein LOC126379686 n=1 Tax=Pectinophora gossypiella TaxID=13191 RepID=UPI00214E72EA|nr:uncharacterized protein LOC126379686 [Pectinophora gossypiella]